MENIINKVNQDYIALALKATMVNGVEPAGDENEKRIYQAIKRVMLAPQGIGILNSGGQVLEWIQMFDNDQSIIDLLNHGIKRFEKFPAHTPNLTTERYLQYPSKKIDEMKADSKDTKFPDGHNGKKCLAKIGKAKPSPGSFLAQVIGRALDKNGQLVADTLNQEHYIQDQFAISPNLVEKLSSALGPNSETVQLPNELGRLCTTFSHLGHIDVRPVFEHNNGKINKYEFTAKRISNDGTLWQVDGKTDVTSELRCNGHGVHDVKLNWKGFIQIKEKKITRIILSAIGKEKLKWGLERAEISKKTPEVCQLPGGRPLDIECGVRYGIIAEPVSDDEIYTQEGNLVGPPDSWQEKIARIQLSVQRWQKEGKDITPVAQIMKEFESLMKRPQPLNTVEDLKQAENMLDRALALLGETRLENSNTETHEPPKWFKEKMQKLNEAVKEFEKFKGQILQEIEKLQRLVTKGEFESASKQIDLVNDMLKNSGQKEHTQGQSERMKSIQEKMTRLQQGIQKWQQDGKDLSPIGTIMQKFEPLLKEDKVKEAEGVLDEALKLLGYKN